MYNKVAQKKGRDSLVPAHLVQAVSQAPPVNMSSTCMSGTFPSSASVLRFFLTLQSSASNSFGKECVSFRARFSLAHWVVEDHACVFSFESYVHGSASRLPPTTSSPGSLSTSTVSCSVTRPRSGQTRRSYDTWQLPGPWPRAQCRIPSMVV